MLKQSINISVGPHYTSYTNWILHENVRY